MWQSQKKCERCEKREMSGALDAPHLTAFYAREELQIKAQNLQFPTKCWPELWPLKNRRRSLKTRTMQWWQGKFTNIIRCLKAFTVSELSMCWPALWPLKNKRRSLATRTMQWWQRESFQKSLEAWKPYLSQSSQCADHQNKRWSLATTSLATTTTRVIWKVCKNI